MPRHAIEIHIKANGLELVISKLGVTIKVKSTGSSDLGNIDM